MQKIQLYIEGQRVDMFTDESVSITQTIQNVKDIGKVFTDFSKTFNLPASKVNNKIFKHYQNFDIENGFDARKKVDAKIELNNKKFRDGKIKLEGVDVREGLPHTYRVTFFGNTVNLKDLLGEDTLASLTWLNNFSHTYAASQVRQGLTEGINKTADSVIYNDALVTPLISNTTRLFYDSVTSYPAYPDEQGGNLYPSGSNMQGVYYEELKYAIRLPIIVKAIEETYGIVFSDDFFKETNLPFYNLYMWLHRKKGFSFDSNSVTYQVINFPWITDEMIEVVCEPDNLKIFGSSQGVEYNLFVTSTSSQPYTVVIKKDGLVFDTRSVSGGNASLSGILTNSSTGYQVFIQTETAMTNVVADWRLTSRTYPENFDYTSDQFNVTLTQEFIITEQIPEMKVVDFLTGLFKMFNLTAFEKDGLITVKTLDNYYYESKKEWDITQYVDRNSSSVDIALPYKRIDLKYEGLDTKLANQHKQIAVKGWGSTEFNAGDNYDGGEGIYEVSAPFEHMKYERLKDVGSGLNTAAQVGWFVDDNNDPYYGQPLLMYCVQSTGTNIRVLNDKVSSFTDVASYFVPSNTLGLTAAESPDSIHFNLEVSEFDFSADFTSTLFNKYYKSYISDIFDNKRRVTKVKAYLPLNFLINYTLADDIKIADRRYIINSIETNLANGESNLELLNIVSEQLPTAGTELDKLPVVDSLSASSVGYDSVTFNGQLTDLGEPNYTERGFYWKVGTGTPTEADNKVVVSGVDLDPFSFNQGGLSETTLYSYVAFATNEVGTATGSVIQATTSAAPVDHIPVVTTSSASSIAYSSAQLNGVVTDAGLPTYTSKGFYWKLGTGTPTASDNVANVGGSGTGSFSAGISSLSELTTYSFVAFCTNSLGTALGAVQTFQTTEQPVVLDPPTVVTYNSSVTGTNSAYFNGAVTYVGNPNYTEKGFVWLEGSGTPTTSNNKVIVGGTSAGSYDAFVSLPTADQTYSVRAYAINSQGTAYGGVNSFQTDAPEVCDGGTLYFNDNVITGVNATLQTAQSTYGTGECGSTIPQIDLILTNNEGEWVSVAQVESIQIYEGSTNVSSSFTLGKYLSGDVMHITIDGSYPNIFNDGDHTYEIRITAYNVANLMTTISLPSTNAVNHASVNVVANTSTSYPASRNDSSYNNAILYPVGEDGDAFEYTITYTADPGYEFTGLGNISQPLVSPSGVGVSVATGTYTSTTLTVVVSGNIQAVDQAATISYSGSAIADPATSISIQYRFSGQSIWNDIPGAGINIGSGGIAIELKVTPDGSWYAQPGLGDLIDSYNPTEDYSGDEIIMTANIRTVGGAEPSQATLLRFYPRASSTSLTSVRFQYYEQI